MKKYIAIATLLAAGSAFASANITLVDMDFTKLTGDSNENMPADWSSGHWNTGGNGPYYPHYKFGENGAVIDCNWKQNYLETSLSNLNSHAHSTIEFTLYNDGEDRGNMFYLSSDSYSIVIGNSYSSNSEIYVGFLNEAVGSSFISFQKNTGKNPTVLKNSEGFNVAGDLTYTLTFNEGSLGVVVTGTSGGSWDTKITGISDVNFVKLGFINDGDKGTAGVKNVTVTTVPEPSTFGLLAGLGALALVGARRRRR